MTWVSWLVLAIIVGGTAAVCGALYSDKGGASHCVGCGKCINSGECVLKQRKKPVRPKKPS